MQQSEDDGDSDSSEKALIEVRDQKPPLSEFDPKIGELFSSMHICLMQKAVRHCLALRDGDSAKRRILIKGMLLGRTTGATLCSLEVSLAEEVAVNLNFQVIRRTMQPHVDPSYLCARFASLLECSLHDIEENEISS